MVVLFSAGAVIELWIQPEFTEMALVEFTKAPLEVLSFAVFTVFWASTVLNIEMPGTVVFPWKVALPPAITNGNKKVEGP